MDPQGYSDCEKTPLSRDKCQGTTGVPSGSSCRKLLKIDPGFSPCGVLSLTCTRPQPFFRGPYCPGLLMKKPFAPQNLDAAFQALIVGQNVVMHVSCDGTN